MRLLVICPHLEPDTAPTGIIMSAILKQFSQLGNEVHAITSLPWYENHQVAEEWVGKGFRRLIQTSNEEFGKVTRCYPFPSSKKSLIGRGIGFIGFTVMAAIPSLFTRKKFDAVIAVSPPLTLGLIGWMASRRHRCPYIFNIQDVFPDVAIQVGAVRSPRMIQLLKRLEIFCYKKANAISVLSQDLERNIQSKIRFDSSKVVVIPNFVDIEKISPSSRNTAYRAELGLGDRLVVMYAGNLGHSQSLDLLVEAANRHRDRKDIVYVINGGGVFAEELKEKAREIPNLVVTGFQPVNRLSEVLATGDIHVVLLKQGLGVSSVPSKIYSTFAAGRPVVASVDPETQVARILSDTNAGIAVPSESPNEFFDAIEKMTENQRRRTEMGVAGRSWVEKQPTAKMVAESYINLFRLIKK